MHFLNVKPVIIASVKQEYSIFFGLDTPEEEVLRTLAMLPDKGSIRGVARATGHSKNTICRWLEIAGTHSKEVTTYFLRNLILREQMLMRFGHYKKSKKM